MNGRSHDEHLDAQRVQALLEGELPEREHTAAEQHVASCVHCRSEVEAWRLLFDELGHLSALAPTERFADRVMDAVHVPAPQSVPRPERTPWAARVRARLWRSRSDRHVTLERLQDLADGVLPVSVAARTERHLAACEACESGLFGWRRIIAALESLPALAPSAGFRERVMARVRVRAPVAARRPSALVALGRALRPSTAKGWALVAGTFAAPSMALAAMALFILAHPLLTPGYLISYLWWRTSAVVTSLGGIALDGLVQGMTGFRSLTAVEFLATSPSVAVAVGLGFSAATVGALWVLYRNLLSAPGATLRHARA